MRFPNRGSAENMKSWRAEELESWRRKRRPIAVGLLLGALASGALLTGCSGKKAGPPPAVPVLAAPVEVKPVPILINAVGTVEPIESVAVRAQVGGAVTRVGFVEGQDVKAGQLLFQIDPRPYQAALDQTKAQLARDKAQAANAQTQARRYADLAAKDYVTQEQNDAAKTQADAMGSVVSADEAAVEAARLNLAYASVTAPVAGRAGAALVKLGNVVKANDATLAVINQIDPIRVSFAIPSDRLPEVQQYRAKGDLPVSVWPTRDKKSDPVLGKLVFVDNAVDNATGTVTLKAEFANAQGLLWPGQFVDVNLTLAVQPNAVVVPQAAVVTGQEGTFVFVIKGDGTAEKRPVKLDRTVDGMAVVQGDLSAAQQVVTDGQVRLVPGSKVELKSSVGAGPAPAEKKGG
jgi:membrane fusion protein, multidrug efflux system